VPAEHRRCLGGCCKAPWGTVGIPTVRLLIARTEGVWGAVPRLQVALSVGIFVVAFVSFRSRSLNFAAYGSSSVATLILVTLKLGLRRTIVGSVAALVLCYLYVDLFHNVKVEL